MKTIYKIAVTTLLIVTVLFGQQIPAQGAGLFTGDGGDLSRGGTSVDGLNYTPDTSGLRVSIGFCTKGEFETGVLIREDINPITGREDNLGGVVNSIGGGFGV